MKGHRVLPGKSTLLVKSRVFLGRGGQPGLIWPKAFPTQIDHFSMLERTVDPFYYRVVRPTVESNAFLVFFCVCVCVFFLRSFVLCDSSFDC